MSNAVEFNLIRELFPQTQDDEARSYERAILVERGIGLRPALSCGGSAVSNAVEFNLIRELFPQTTAGLDELIEVMADGV